MLNLMRTAKEIEKLRQLVANQKETIDKAMQVIEQLADDNIKLQDENKKLQDENKKLQDENKKLISEIRKLNLKAFYHDMRSSPDDVIFPNTDPRGLNDPSNSEPEGLDNIY